MAEDFRVEREEPVKDPVVMEPIDPLRILEILVRVVFRRFPLLLIPFPFLVPVSIMAFKKAKKSYSTSTKLMIQEGELANPFLKNYMISLRLKKRMNFLMNMMKSHAIVGQLVDHNAKRDKKRLTPKQRHGAVNAIRGAIKFMQMGYGLMEIKYGCRRPRVCLENLNFMMKRFIEVTLEPEKVAIQRSAKFLKQQVRRIKLQLKKVEQQMMRDKVKYALSLPKAFGTNLMAYFMEKKSYTRNRIRLAAAKRKRDFLFNKVRFLDPILDRLKAKQIKLEVELAKKEGSYGKNHPSIRQLKFDIKQTKIAVKEYTPLKGRSLKEIERFFSWKKPPPGMFKDPKTGKLKANSVTPLDRLQESLVEVAVLKNTVKKQEQLLGTMTKYMKNYPKAESKILKMERDVKVLDQLYTKLRLLYEESLIRRELQIYENKTRFQVIEPATLPLFPDSPKILLFLIGGIAGSIAIGGMLIVVAELFEKSIQDEIEAVQLLELEVIANVQELPELWV